MISRRGNLKCYLIGFVEEADAVAFTKSVDVIRETALGEFVGLDTVEANDRLRHDAAVPVAAVALFAIVVVTHADIVTNHVSHCARHKVGLVRIDIDTQSSRFWRADCLWNGHSGRSTRKTLAPFFKKL